MNPISTFVTIEKGNTAEIAFSTARAKAMYDGYGHTGTISEKNKFIMIPILETMEPRHYAALLLNGNDSRLNGANGPAGCFDLGDGSFMFFGFAEKELDDTAPLFWE